MTRRIRPLRPSTSPSPLSPISRPGRRTSRQTLPSGSPSLPLTPMTPIFDEVIRYGFQQLIAEAPEVVPPGIVFYPLATPTMIEGYGDHVYVLISNAGRLLKIDEAGLLVEASPAISGTMRSFCIISGVAWVASTSGSDTIFTEIDLTDMSVSSSTTVAGQLFYISSRLSGDASYLYWCTGSATRVLRRFNTSTLTEGSTVTLTADTNFNLRMVATTTDGSLAALPRRPGSGSAAPPIVIVDPSTFTVDGSIAGTGYTEYIKDWQAAGAASLRDGSYGQVFDPDAGLALNVEDTFDYLFKSSTTAHDAGYMQHSESHLLALMQNEALDYVGLGPTDESVNIMKGLSGYPDILGLTFSNGYAWAFSAQSLYRIPVTLPHDDPGIGAISSIKDCVTVVYAHAAVWTIDGGTVYKLDSSTLATSASYTPPHAVHTGQSPMAADDSYVYVLNATYVMRLDPTTGTWTSFAHGIGTPQGIWVTTSGIWLTSVSTIYKMTPGGSFSSAAHGIGSNITIRDMTEALGVVHPADVSGLHDQWTFDPTTLAVTTGWLAVSDATNINYVDGYLWLRSFGGTFYKVATDGTVLATTSTTLVNTLRRVIRVVDGIGVCSTSWGIAICDDGFTQQIAHFGMGTTDAAIYPDGTSEGGDDVFALVEHNDTTGDCVVRLRISQLPPALVENNIETTGYVTDATKLGSATKVAVAGDFAVVGCSDNRVTVVDLSTPTAPVARGTLVDATNLAGITRVVAYSATEVLVCAFSVDRLIKIDISDPDNPTITGNLLSSNLDGIRDVVVDGTTGYTVGSGTSGRRVTSVNLSTMAVLDSVADSFNLTNGGAIVVKDDHAVAFSTSWIVPVDKSTPSSLVLGTAVAQSNGIPTITAALAGDVAVVVAGTTIRMSDLSTPSTPVGASPNYGGGYTFSSVIEYSTTRVLLAASGSVMALDTGVSSGFPYVVAKYSPAEASGNLADIALYGNYVAAIAPTNDRLVLVDISSLA